MCSRTSFALTGLFFSSEVGGRVPSDAAYTGLGPESYAAGQPNAYHP